MNGDEKYLRLYNTWICMGWKALKRELYLRIFIDFLYCRVVVTPPLEVLVAYFHNCQCTIVKFIHTISCFFFFSLRMAMNGIVWYNLLNWYVYTYIFFFIPERNSSCWVVDVIAVVVAVIVEFPLIATGIESVKFFLWFYLFMPFLNFIFICNIYNIYM